MPLIKERLGLQTQGVDNVPPRTTCVTLQQPTTITVVNAETAVLIVMRRATSRPAIAASRDATEARDEINHDRAPLP